MEIIRGKLPGAKKIVIYGPEGIGKSTFASRFPDPVFIDTEGSTKDMDVARFQAPASWSALMEEVRYVFQNPDTCKTLIIDTADWAEQLCTAGICSKYQKSGIEDFGYGKGYVFLQEEFGRLLNLLSDLVEQKGIHVVLTAHAKMRKFEQPDELGAYDRWEMKLSKNVAPMVKEWADMVLFANYKTHVVNVEGKNKAQGGRRVMYTTHHSCWDAKNRYGLSEELPFEYEAIAHVMEDKAEPAQTSQAKETFPNQSAPESEKEAPKQEPDPVSDTGQQMSLPLNEPQEQITSNIDPGIPKALRDLMEMHHVDEWDLQAVVAARGYYPEDVPIRDYDGEFINGCLIGAWEQVYGMVKEMKEKQEIPFN